MKKRINTGVIPHGSSERGKCKIGRMSSGEEMKKKRRQPIGPGNGPLCLFGLLGWFAKSITDGLIHSEVGLVKQMG